MVLIFAGTCSYLLILDTPLDARNIWIFRCLLKWNARIKWNFSGTNGQCLEVLHFFRSNRFELKLSLHLHQISFLLLVLKEA